MNPLGVVKNEIVHQKAIEFFRIKQKVGMIIDKLLLERSIESLNVSIHLGSLRVGMVVNEMKLFQSSGILCFEILWFPDDFLTINFSLSAKVREFLGIQSQAAQVFD